MSDQGIRSALRRRRKLLRPEQRARLEREADRILAAPRKPVAVKRKSKLKSSEPLPRFLHLSDLGTLRSRGLVP